MDIKAKKFALPEEEWCEICFIKFTSQSMMQRHQNSVSHKKKKLIQNLKDDRPFCKICSKVFNGFNQLKYHLKSDMHYNQLANKKKYMSSLTKIQETVTSEKSLLNSFLYILYYLNKLNYV